MKMIEIIRPRSSARNHGAANEATAGSNGPCKNPAINSTAINPPESPAMQTTND